VLSLLCGRYYMIRQQDITVASLSYHSCCCYYCTWSVVLVGQHMLICMHSLLCLVPAISISILCVERMLAVMHVLICMHSLLCLVLAISILGVECITTSTSTTTTTTTTVAKCLEDDTVLCRRGLCEAFLYIYLKVALCVEWVKSAHARKVGEQAMRCAWSV